MSRHRRVYALYKGEEFLDIGYANELAEKWNMPIRSIHWRAACKRWNSIKHKGGYVVVPLEDDEEE